MPPASEPALFSVRPHAPTLLALGERDEEPLLLLFRTGQEDVPRAEAVVRGDREGHSGVDPGEFLDHDRVLEGRQPGAAVFLRPDRSHESQFAGLREHLTGKLLLLVPLAGVRSDLALGKFADGLLEEQLLLVEAEIQGVRPA